MNTKDKLKASLQIILSEAAKLEALLQKYEKLVDRTCKRPLLEMSISEKIKVAQFIIEIGEDLNDETVPS